MSTASECPIVLVDLGDFTDRSSGDDLTVEVIVGDGDDVEFLGPFDIEDSEPEDVWGPIIGRILEAAGFWLDDPGDVSWSDIRDDMSSPHILITIHSTYRWERPE